MKGRIKGTDLYTMEISEEGIMVIERHGGSAPQKMHFSPAQAYALAAFVKDSEEEMEKKYNTAYWSK